MNKESLPSRIEALSSVEKSKLLKRFIAVLILGLAMGVFIIFFMNFFQKNSSFGIIPMIFEFFFFGILLFIVITHGLNAFQKTKTIYTGVVTDKYANSSKFKNSSQQITHFIQLDGVPFSLDQNLYDKCHKGEKIDLHILGKSRVFDVTFLNNRESENHDSEIHYRHSENSNERNHIHTSTNFYPATEGIMELGELNIINKKLIRAFLFRGALGLVGTYFLFMILFVVVLIIGFDSQWYNEIYWTILIICSALYLLINRKTLRLLNDKIYPKVIYETESVIDLERSNMPKPSRHSIVTYQGYSYRSDLFFYVRTQHYWLQISQELYENLEAGDQIRIKSSKNAKIKLEVTKVT